MFPYGLDARSSISVYLKIPRMFLSWRDARAAPTRVVNMTGLSTNGTPRELAMKNGTTDAKAAGFSHVQMRDGLKITLLNAVLARAFSSTALFARRYFSRNAMGDLNVHPASAALTKTKGIGAAVSDDTLLDKQSIAANAERVKSRC